MMFSAGDNYALVIGVGEFSKASFNLDPIDIAASDAEAVYRFLTDPVGGIFGSKAQLLVARRDPNSFVHRLFVALRWAVAGHRGEQEQATADQIQARIDRMFNSASERSICLLWFTGHGFKHGGKYYLAAKDTVREAGSKPLNAIDCDAIKKAIKNSKCRAIVVVLNSCYASEFKNEFVLDRRAAPEESAWALEMLFASHQQTANVKLRQSDKVTSLTKMLWLLTNNPSVHSDKQSKKLGLVSTSALLEPLTYAAIAADSRRSAALRRLNERLPRPAHYKDLGSGVPIARNSNSVLDLIEKRLRSRCEDFNLPQSSLSKALDVLSSIRNDGKVGWLPQTGLPKSRLSMLHIMSSEHLRRDEFASRLNKFNAIASGFTRRQSKPPLSAWMKRDYMNAKLATSSVGVAIGCSAVVLLAAICSFLAAQYAYKQAERETSAQVSKKIFAAIEACLGGKPPKSLEKVCEEGALRRRFQGEQRGAREPQVYASVEAYDKSLRESKWLKAAVERHVQTILESRGGQHAPTAMQLPSQRRDAEDTRPSLRVKEDWRTAKLRCEEIFDEKDCDARLGLVEMVLGGLRRDYLKPRKSRQPRFKEEMSPGGG